MILPILAYGDLILRKKAINIEESSEDLDDEADQNKRQTELKRVMARKD